MSTWIKCIERMPDHDGEVLVSRINKNGAPGNVTSARWFDPYKDLRPSIREDWEVGCWWRGDWSIQIDEVTHWMPLPEPPSE